MDTIFDSLPLGEPVALAFLLGLFTALLLVGVWYGIPAAFWWWEDRHPAATVDELLDVETCDICLVVLTEDNEALTCDSHRYCAACDDDSNRCTACAEARGLALLEVWREEIA